MPRINWGQAAGEAVLILVGILLALGAEAWWDERTERVREAEYLAALVVELEQMTSHIEDVIRGAEEIEAAGEVILQALPDWGAEIGPDSMGVLLTTVSYEVGWAPPTTVYQDLINTGAVGIIRSDEVRRGLNELMGSLDWVESRQIRHDEFFWSEMDPYYRAHLPIASLFGYEDLVSASWRGGEFRLTPEFENLVAAKAMSARDVREGAEELIGQISALSRMVTDAAGGPQDQL